jgi:hypothetical protein
MDTIFAKYDLPAKGWATAAIKEADTMALKCEARQLLPSGGKDWLHMFPVLGETFKDLYDPRGAFRQATLGLSSEIANAPGDPARVCPCTRGGCYGRRLRMKTRAFRWTNSIGV